MPDMVRKLLASTAKPKPEGWMEEFLKRIWPSLAQFIGNKVRAKIADQALSGQNVDELHRELETAEKNLAGTPLRLPLDHKWLNKVLAIFWPILGKLVNALVKDKVIPQVKDKLPDFLKNIDINPCDLGATAPMIEEFEVLAEPVSTGWMDIKCVLRYKAEPNIALSTKFFSLALRDFDFNMTTYLSFYGLLDKPPFFAGMSFYMCKPPEVKLKWSGVAEQLDHHRLNSIINKAVAGSMAKMVLPHRRTKLLGEHDENTMHIVQPKPRGVFWLEVVEADGLVGDDLTLETMWTGELSTDPYVRVFIGPEGFKTPSIQKDTNPEWHEDNVHFWPIDMPDQQEVDLSVYDDGMMQTLYKQAGLEESSADEIARFDKPIKITDLLGVQSAAALDAEIGPIERWIDLKSWWPGKGTGMERLQDKDAKAASAGNFLERNWAWMKDQMDERRTRLMEEKRQELENAEARIKLRMHWKPLGDPKAPEGEKPSKKSLWQKVQDVGAEKDRLLKAASQASLNTGPQIVPPQAPDAGFRSSEAPSNINTTEVEDASDDEMSEDEETWKGWPTHVIGITIKRVDRVRCMEDEGSTSYKVVCSVNNAVNRNGYLVRRTEMNNKAGITQNETKALVPLMGSMSALQKKDGSEHEEVRAHKIAMLMAHDVPENVICEVMEELDEKTLARAKAEAMARSSRLRTVEFLENMTFFSHADEPITSLKFEVIPVVNKVDGKPVYEFTQGIECLDDGHGRYIKIHSNMNCSEDLKTSARIWADVQIWPFVKWTKPLVPQSQIDVRRQMDAQLEMEKMNKKFCLVEIFSASNLRKADLIGHSDPFCKLKLGTTKKAKELFQTQVIDDTANPVWKEDGDESPPPTTVEWGGETALKFEVWDQDFMKTGDYLGGVVVKKADAMRGMYTDLYLGDGDAKLRVKITPAGYRKDEKGELKLMPTLKVPLVFQEAKAKPVIEVFIKSAEGLRALNMFGGKSDPYVIAKLGDSKQIRTNVIYDTLDPVWNHGPEEMVDDGEAKLTFEVKDKDLIGSTHLGKAVLKREKFEGEGFNGALNLGQHCGVLHVEVKMLAEGTVKEPFKLKVKIISAKDLRNTDTFGASDPYVICKVRGKPVFQTEVIWDDLNPVWNHEEKEVMLEDFKDIKFDVFDKDMLFQGDFLGSAGLTRNMCEKGFVGDLSLGKGNGTLQVDIKRVQDEGSKKKKTRGTVADVAALSMISALSNKDNKGVSPAASPTTSPAKTKLQRVSLNDGTNEGCFRTTLGQLRRKFREILGKRVPAHPPQRATLKRRESRRPTRAGTKNVEKP